MKKLPPLGAKIRTLKSISCSGKVVLFEKPNATVVGHHIDGERFFFEYDKTGVIQIHDIKNNQWDYVEPFEAIQSYPY